MMHTASLVALGLFIGALGSVVVALFTGVAAAERRLGAPAEVRRRRLLWVALGVLCWLGATGAMAGAGLLRDFSGFPALPPLLLVSTLLTIGLAFSPMGWRLAAGVSLTGLVGFQVFRVLVELFLAQLYHVGIVPVQMTFEGRNFDIISGVAALPVAWLAARGRLPRWGLLLWNVVSLGLLLNIVGVAALSLPTPLRVFQNEPANTFIAEFPFVWLPTLLVPAALCGHLLVFRRLWAERRQPGQSRQIAPTL